MKVKMVVALVSLCMGLGAQNVKIEKMERNELTPKQCSLITVAAFEAKGNQEGLKKAIGEALDRQLTVNEVKEALSQLYAYTGFPRSLNALGTLQGVLADRESQGLAVDEGREASSLPVEYDALKQGTEVQTRLTGKAFNYAFSPSTDFYLKAHLFGDIFARDILSFPERELVTIGALSAMDGVEPQLKAHVSGARNMGVTDAELHAVSSVLEKEVGEMEAYRVRKAVAEVFGEDFTEGRPIDKMMFPKGELNTAYARYFIGNSFLAPLLQEGLPMSNVTFEPRCRNNWHIHHKGGQILICVGGEGWYQEWGKPAQRLYPGDVVNIPAEVKHWHGATADSWFQHIAIGVPAEGASTEWLEPVTDEEFNRLK